MCSFLLYKCFETLKLVQVVGAHIILNGFMYRGEHGHLSASLKPTADNNRTNGFNWFLSDLSEILIELYNVIRATLGSYYMLLLFSYYFIFVSKTCASRLIRFSRLSTNCVRWKVTWLGFKKKKKHFPAVAFD